MKKVIRAVALFSSIAALGCSQKSDRTALSPASVPVDLAVDQKEFETIPEPIGTNCEAGGWKYTFGVDANKDGRISEGEVTLNKFVCHGLAGLRGTQGPAGTQGVAGPMGQQGLTGAAGPQGLAGPAGPIGLSGLQGAPGLKGATGLTGASVFPVAASLKLSEARRLTESNQLVSGTTWVKESTLVVLPHAIKIGTAHKATSATNGWLSLKLDRTLFCYSRSVGAVAFILRKQKISGSKSPCETSHEDNESLTTQVFVARDSQIEFTINSALSPRNQMFAMTLVLNGVEFRQQ